MRRKRELSHDLNRLTAATLMFARQQSERILLGDDLEREDVERETHGVVTDVVNRIEQSLDEDFVERLEQGDNLNVFSPWDAWRNTFALGGLRPTNFGSRALFGMRETTMLDEILGDFRANVQVKLRQARRDDRPLTDAEIDELLSDLREDLKVIVRRTRRRDERREKEEVDGAAKTVK
jgi:hypothetical protein